MGRAWAARRLDASPLLLLRCLAVFDEPAVLSSDFPRPHGAASLEVAQLQSPGAAWDIWTADLFTSHFRLPISEIRPASADARLVLVCVESGGSRAAEEVSELKPQRGQAKH